MVALSPITEIEIDDLSVKVPPDLQLVGQGAGRATAFECGVIAASYGFDKEKDNPYSEGRGSGSFRKAWTRGFEAYHATAERAAK